MKITLQGFLGRIPLAADHLLPDNAATVADNCTTKRGLIDPLNVPLYDSDPSKTGTVLSIYKFGNYWFNWLTDVDCVRGPVPGDTQSRTYFTGDGVPKMTLATIATSGSDFPTASYTLGIPAPASAPTTSVQGTANPDPPDDGTEEDRAYVYTYVSAYGEEGPPSDPSTIVTWAPGQTVDVTMLGAPTGTYNITHKRIYRTLTTQDGTDYFLVAEIAVGSGTSGSPYSDSVDSADLIATLATSTFDPPPDDLFGLCALAGGFLAGFSGNRVCFCEPYQPHAWPVDYRFTVDDDVVGGGVFGNSLLVTTGNNTYVISGDSPDAMSEERLEISQACVSKRGIADLGDALAYPSPDGLMVVSVSGIENATRKILTRDQWQAYQPDSLLGVAHDGCYYGFYDTGTVQAGFVIDFSTGTFRDIDTYATAAFTDPLTDKLYLVVDGDIVSFNEGATKMTAVWKSRVMVLPKNSAVGVGQVHAEDYPVSVSLLVDGSVHDTVTVNDSEPFYFLAEGIGRKFQVSITGTETIEQITLASTMREIR